MLLDVVQIVFSCSLHKLDIDKEVGASVFLFFLFIVTVLLVDFYRSASLKIVAYLLL